MLIFLRSAKYLKFYPTSEIFLAHYHVGLKISKRHAYNYHPISSIRYEDIGSHMGMQASTSTGNPIQCSRVI